MSTRTTRWARSHLLAVALAFAVVAAACGGSDDDSDAADESSDATAADTGSAAETDGDEPAGGDPEAGLVEALGLPECPVGAHLEADGPVEVEVWHALVTLSEEALQEMAAGFNASQDEIVVTVQSQGGYGDLYRQYKDSIATNGLPAVAILQDTAFREMTDLGTVLPAQSCIEAEGYDTGDFVPIAVEAYSLDGAVWPGAVNANSLLFYYNRDHFIAAGLDPDDPPETLDEIRAASEAIAAANIPGVEQPWAVRVDAWLIENLRAGARLPMVTDGNGRDREETPESAFNDERTLELMTLLDEMNDEGLLFASPATSNNFDHYFAVAEGKSSMLIETSTAATTIAGLLAGEEVNLAELAEANDVDAADVELRLDLGVGEFPGFEESGGYQLGGGAWYMASTLEPEVQAGAWEFLKYVNELEQQKLNHLKGSYLPVRESVIEDPEVQFAWDNVVAGEWLSIGFQQFAALDTDFPGPLIGPYEETRDRLKVMMEEILFEGSDPQSSIDTAETDINSFLATYEDQNF